MAINTELKARIIHLLEEGKTYAEIAEATGVTTTVIGSINRRGNYSPRLAGRRKVMPSASEAHETAIRLYWGGYNHDEIRRATGLHQSHTLRVMYHEYGVANAQEYSGGRTAEEARDKARELRLAAMELAREALVLERIAEVMGARPERYVDTNVVTPCVGCGAPTHPHKPEAPAEAQYCTNLACDRYTPF